MSCNGSHSWGKACCFPFGTFQPIAPSLMTSPHPVQVYHSLQRMRHLCSVVEAQWDCACVCENKRYFEVKKSSLGLEFIRFWRDSGRNKGKEWEFFFLLCYATTWALSLSTSSVLIGPHPLTQDSLLFWSSIISCNVLNLESPSKSSASLQLCLFLYFFFLHFGAVQIANCCWFYSPGLRIFLMEMNPVQIRPHSLVSADYVRESY